LFNNTNKLSLHITQTNSINCGRPLLALLEPDKDPCCLRSAIFLPSEPSESHQGRHTQVRNARIDAGRVLHIFDSLCLLLTNNTV